MSGRGVVNLFEPGDSVQCERYDCRAKSGVRGRMIEFSKADSSRISNEVDLERYAASITVC